MTDSLDSLADDDLRNIIGELLKDTAPAGRQRVDAALADSIHSAADDSSGEPASLLDALPGISPDTVYKGVPGLSVSSDDDQDDGQPYNLLVAGLDREVDDARLRALFEPFGEVRSAVVMRRGSSGTSRGFGFVLFTTGEHGKTARRALHQSALPGSGNTISVVRSRHTGSETTEKLKNPAHPATAAAADHVSARGAAGAGRGVASSRAVPHQPMTYGEARSAVMAGAAAPPAMPALPTMPLSSFGPVFAAGSPMAASLGVVPFSVAYPPGAVAMTPGYAGLPGAPMMLPAPYPVYTYPAPYAAMQPVFAPAAYMPSYPHAVYAAPPGAPPMAWPTRPGVPTGFPMRSTGNAGL